MKHLQIHNLQCVNSVRPFISIFATHRCKIFVIPDFSDLKLTVAELVTGYSVERELGGHLFFPYFLRS